MAPVVFVDTNALVAMLCFPRPSKGRLPLAHEIADAVAAGECRLLISDVVAEELRTVVMRDFPSARRYLPEFLDGFGVTLLAPPTKQQLEQYRRVCSDPDDAPILAAALAARRQHGARLLLSNDIETFHTNAMKAFLAEHGIVPITLYGLLRLLGRRSAS